MENEKLKIVTLKELLEIDLSIPNYQRPYRWTTESALILFDDIYSAYKATIPEYRMGSVVLHKAGDTFEIVDGQQRITTLTILTYCFDTLLKTKEYSTISKLLNKKNSFSELSIQAVVDNFQVLKRRCEMIKEELEKFISYAFEHCTFVKIVTNSEQEAFQFFDSQNSRGKALEPQDLLKSYHLREMTESPESEKVNIINAWEDENQRDLALFFENNLYPLVRWYISKDGLYYSSKKIKTFKGIKQKCNYNYSIYHKAANLYIEHFNSEGMYELVSGEKISQFQLTQPLIAGKRFFLFTLYYLDLYKTAVKIIESKYDSEYITNKGSGNSYIKNLFVNVVVFFIDKFNIRELTDSRLHFLYTWAYSLRVVMHSVYPQTVNRYALGHPDCRVNKGLNIFMKIYEMQNPQELDSMILDGIELEQTVKIVDDNVTKYKFEKLWNYIFREK